MNSLHSLWNKIHPPHNHSENWEQWAAMNGNMENEDNSIVLAIDDSVHAQDTVNYYVNKVHRPRNRVVLCYVIEIPENAQQAMHSMMSRDTLQEMWKVEEDKAEDLEADYVELLKSKGVEHITIRNEGGMKPGHLICHVAEEEKACMIVIGSRGAGKIRRTILGSVSDYVVNHAHCPVLVCNYGKERARHSSNEENKKDSRQRHGSGNKKDRDRHPSGRERLRKLSGKSGEQQPQQAPLKSLINS